ncbi:MAG: glycosyltransferase family 2 protein [Saccharofermentanales bacterium]
MEMNVNIDADQQESLVSIIMPAFNCAEYIGRTIDSVIGQSYHNWEIIIADDCSTDDTAAVVQAYRAADPRIRYIRMDRNSGAAMARNMAVELAQGRYLAFLDSDDVWFPDKLTRQIDFMKRNCYAFTCTSYTKIDADGRYLDRTVQSKPQSDYESILKSNPGNSTVIYDASLLGKHQIPDIRKRNDYVMWLAIIKKAKILYGMPEALGSHRVREGSISKNKFSLVKYHWKVYREIEKLSLFKSCYLVVYWIAKTILKF